MHQSLTFKHTHTFPLGMESRVALFCSRIVSAGDFALKLLGTVYERAFGVKASSHTCSMSQPGTPHTHFQTIVKLIFHKPGIKDFLFFFSSFLSSFRCSSFSGAIKAPVLTLLIPVHRYGCGFGSLLGA